MGYNNPTITDFKNYFVRDFPYGVSQTTVMDQDISNALQETDVNFNPGFFPNQGAFTIGFLLLTAHNLVMNLRASSQGLSGQYPWLQTAKGVGSVNEAFQIPQRILDNPEWAMITKTYYGSKYLAMILPYMAGQMFTVCGGTNA